MSITDKKIARIISCGVMICSLTLGLFVSGYVLAASADLTRSYETTVDMVEGSLVSVDPEKEGFVVLANASSDNQLLGVVVRNENSLMGIDAQEGNVQVAVSGKASVLVSTLNGEIKNGDLISESVISGVAARATEGSRVIGIAQEDFSESTEGVTQQTVNDNRGKSVDLAIGYLPIVVAVGSVGTKQDSSPIPESIQRIADSIAGKPVPLARLLFSVVIGMIGLGAMVMMVYSSIQTSIAAVSRNPLAKPAIFEALAQVMSMVAFISIICVASMFAVLRF